MSVFFSLFSGIRTNTIFTAAVAIFYTSMSVLEGKSNEALDRVKAVSLGYIFISFGVLAFLSSYLVAIVIVSLPVVPWVMQRSSGFLPSFSTINCNCHSCVSSCFIIADIPLPAVL